MNKYYVYKKHPDNTYHNVGETYGTSAKEVKQLWVDKFRWNNWINEQTCKVTSKPMDMCYLIK